MDREETQGEFEEGIALHRTHREFSEKEADALQAATDKITEVTSNQFLKDAYVAATNIRNVLGDGDAYAAQEAETIRSSILVIAQEIERNPTLFVIRAAKVEDSEAFRDNLLQVIDDLYSIVHNISEGDAKE